VGRGQHQLLDAGARAPDFRLPALDGNEFSLTEIAARGPVLLAFFKISCPVCQLTLPYLERVHQAGALAIYGISQNDARDTQQFAARYGVTFPMLLDTEKSGFPASNAYGISSVPTMFLIERDGVIAQVMQGWRRDEMAAIGAVGPDDKVPQWKAG
jgi:peroxiredoxin